MLKIDNASARIAGITVLRDITTEFKPGQLLAVVGRNGAGKTTLLRAIMGLLPLSSGSISIEGHDLSKIPGHRRTEYGIGVSLFVIASCSLSSSSAADFCSSDVM